MQTDYAREYQQLYQQHWWWRAREEFVVATLERHRPRAGGNVLDIGCGDGLFFPLLQRYGAVEGIEADASLVSTQKHAHGVIHVGPFGPAFQPGKTYRLIVMLDVLEHLADAEEALHHALDLLDPNGVLLITVPAFRLLWTRHDDMNHHYTRYTEHSFRLLARRCGMQIDECRYFYHWLFPLKLAVRMKEWWRPSEPQPPQIPQQPWNEWLIRLSQFEQRLFAHVAPPFGSSLLAVGRNAPGRRRRLQPVAPAVAVPLVEAPTETQVSSY